MITPPRFCTARRRAFAHAAALLRARVLRLPAGRHVLSAVADRRLVRA